MAKITDLDQNLVGGNEPRNLVGDTSITVEPLELKAKSVLQILKNFRNYIIENAVKGDTGAQGLSIIDVDITLTSESSTGNTYTLTCTLSDNSTITAGTFFVPKGDKGDTGDTGATGNGIASITKTGTVDLVDTYRITFTDGTYFDFNVTNGANGQDGATGNGIASIVKTGTVGLVDSYTINFTDGTHFDYTVTNGAKGDTGATGATGNGIASITKTGTVDLVDTYRITFTNGAYFDYTVTNGAKGDTGATGATGNGIASITKTGTSGLVDTYTILYTNGNTDTFTVTNGVDGAGTEIYVNGVAVSSVSFTSDPQTQITNLGSGKQDKIDSSHKLSADLVEDGTTNKVFTATEQSKLAGIASGAEVNVQSDWNQSNSSADDYIKNKPTIPTTTDSVTSGSASALTSGGAYTALSGKLDKVTGTTTNSQAYIKVSDGSQAMGDLVAGLNTPNTIPYRDGNGRLQGADPSASNDLIPKGYGDSTYATKTLSNVTYPANTSGSTTTGSGDRVIETYISSDTKKWYRKWASGWKEAGGVITGTSGEYTTTFGVTFTVYPSIQITKASTGNKTSGTAYYDHLFVYGLTTAQFKVYRTGDAGGSSYLTYYYACGY